MDASEDDCGRIIAFILHRAAATSWQGLIGAGWGKFKSAAPRLIRLSISTNSS